MLGFLTNYCPLPSLKQKSYALCDVRYYALIQNGEETQIIFFWEVRPGEKNALNLGFVETYFTKSDKKVELIRVNLTQIESNQEIRQ